MKKIACGLSAFFLVLVFSYGPAGSASGDHRDRTIERKVLELVNRVRAKGVNCGTRYYAATHPVRWSVSLAEASLGHSLDMARRESMDHTGGDGSDPGKRIARAGYRWMTYGENVGEGYLTPEEVVNGWLRSKSHCENIMNPGFREAGAAFAKGAKRLYWTLVLAAPGPSSFIGP